MTPTENPTNIPQSWTAGLQSLTDLAKAIDWASTYTQTQLDKFLTADPTCAAIKSTAKALSTFPSINTIFIVGPSGHGKECLARAMHCDPNKPFIPVNMAGLPSTLISSLLFGHAAGTFTGATADRAGVFEAAQYGTVFLDEIGDMPAEQQPILLRILQEREVTRLGETATRPINCRIIAATNSPDKLRDDLYGRLMGCMLTIPPLTQRPADVQLILASLNLPPDTPIDPDKLDRFGARYLQSLATAKLIGL